jgi:hypothetical protein
MYRQSLPGADRVDALQWGEEPGVIVLRKRPLRFDEAAEIEHLHPFFPGSHCRRTSDAATAATWLARCDTSL